VRAGEGEKEARALLADGRAWRKFQAICDAQGGMREPTTAKYHYEVVASRSGRVSAIENRKLARVAKLSGAPRDPAAGVQLHSPLGKRVEKGEPLFSIFAEAPGELDYALAYVESQSEIISIDGDG
jgi:thymidine phosphorylase